MKNCLSGSSNQVSFLQQQHHQHQQKDEKGGSSLRCLLMDIWKRQKGEEGETVKKPEVKDLWTFSSLEALPSSETEATTFDKEPESERGENASSFNYKCLECHSNLHHHKMSHAKCQIISHFQNKAANTKAAAEDDDFVERYFEQIRVIFQIGEKACNPDKYLARVLRCLKCASYFAMSGGGFEGSEIDSATLVSKEARALIHHLLTSKCWQGSSDAAKTASPLEARR